MGVGRRPGCIPKIELVCATVSPVVMNDRPGSACCTEEIVRMANMKMKEHKALSSAFVRCHVERCL